MNRLLLCAVVLLVVAPGYCQNGPPSPSAPPVLGSGPGMHPGPPGPPAEADRSGYPQWMSAELTGAAREYLDAYPQIVVAIGAVRLLARPLLFLVLFAFVGRVFGLLVTRAIMPPLGDAHQKDGREGERARRLRWARLGVWIGALYVASEAAALPWLAGIAKMVSELLGVVMPVVGTVFGAAVLGTAALAFTAFGRDLLLSVIGALYLRGESQRASLQEELDLGDGVRGRVLRVDALHTIFDLGDGRTVTRPNAWLMRERYGWGAKEEGGQRPA